MRLVMITLMIGLLCAYAGLRVIGNLAAHMHEPAACQLFGGSWGPWDGWRCY